MQVVQRKVLGWCNELPGKVLRTDQDDQTDWFGTTASRQSAPA